jgi:polyhydroxyalkanoate synthase subunit PhaC
MLQRSISVARTVLSAPPTCARLGITPHQAIHLRGSAWLRHFPSIGGGAPLFLCMPLINRWTIWDLLEGHSVVAALTAAGHDVFLLDWGAPGPEASERTLGDLVDGTVGRALSVAHRRAGQPLHAVGYCVGGTVLAMHLARRPQAPVRSMALVAAPIDFKAAGRLSTWANPQHFPLDEAVDGFGNFPARLMRSSFVWLAPMGRAKSLRALWERHDQDGFRELWSAIEAWNADPVDFPGEAYRTYVRGCYFDNALIEGGLCLDGTPVDLRQGRLPALAIAASRDHIAPAPSVHALASVWGGSVQEQTLAGGHVSISLRSALPDALLEWVAP